jgi:hypothetical protein
VYDREANIDNLSTSTPSTNRIKLSLNQILKVRKAARKPTIQDFGKGFFVKTDKNTKTLMIKEGRSSKILKTIADLNINMASINHIEFYDIPRVKKTTVKFDYDDEEGEWKCPCGARGFSINSIYLHWQCNKHYNYDQEFA